MNWRCCATRYWHEVREAGLDITGKVFVDKHPLHSLKLPLIARLFPRAKILFAHRDPRDVVLELLPAALQHESGHVPAADAEGVAAAFYDATMSLAEQARPILGLEWRVVRYEDLVGDLEQQLRSVCDASAWSGSRTWGILRRAPRRASARRPARRNWHAGSTNQAWVTGGITDPRWSRSCRRSIPGCSAWATRQPR